jgi:hypothetical protein
MECRTLAGAFPAGCNRDQLLKLADLWEAMARERAALVLRQPDLSDDREDEQRAEPAVSRRKP